MGGKKRSGCVVHSQHHAWAPLQETQPGVRIKLIKSHSHSKLSVCKSVRGRSTFSMSVYVHVNIHLNVHLSIYLNGYLIVKIILPL